MLYPSRSLNFLTVALALALATVGTAQTIPCTSNSPLVGGTYLMGDAVTKVALGNLTVIDDCTSRLTAYSPPAGVVVSLMRSNGGVVESIFTSEIINALGSQNFTLKPGFALNVGDIIIVANPARQPLALAQLAAAPRPTTTIELKPTQTASEAVSSNVPYDSRTLILVNVGPNANYPNPPAPLNVSLYINNVETPELTLVRGTTYAFSIMAGETHPFYLTTSSEGGKGNSTSAEIIFLGNKNSFGTIAAPKLLSFTPTAVMPSDFYYQCYSHKRMGWKVKLVNSADEAKGSVFPPTPKANGVRTHCSIVAVFVGVLSTVVFSGSWNELFGL